MTGALIILAAVVIAGAALYLFHRRSVSKTPDEQETSPAADEEVCCGMHITCEKDSLLTAASKEIVYYDDEELDQYAGRGADDYADDEIEQFRDILLTLLPGDIAGWGRSVQSRGITLPTAVREELLMIVAEARQAAAK